MKKLIVMLAMIIFLVIPIVYGFNSTSYSVDSEHIGLNGGNGSSSTYSARDTLVYQQEGNADLLSANYRANSGWFDVIIDVNNLVGSVSCSNDTVNYYGCDTMKYGMNITHIRTSCVSGAAISDVKYTLFNAEDNTSYIDNASYTFKSGSFYTLNSSYVLQDSGTWNLSVDCYASGVASNQTNWTLQWGVVNVTLVNPSINTSVIQYKFFNFIVNVSCVGGECGNVSVTLDPFAHERKVEKPRLRLRLPRAPILSRFLYWIRNLYTPFTGLIVYENYLSIPISLEYKTGTQWDTDDDGIESVEGVVDLTIENTPTDGINTSNLCTKWETIGEEYSTTICYGNEACCAFIELLPQEGLAWDSPFESTYGRYGAGWNNTVRSQILYVDYSLDPENPYSDIRVSGIEALRVEFVNDTVVNATNVTQNVTQSITQNITQNITTNVTENVTWNLTVNATSAVNTTTNFTLIFTDKNYRVIDSYASDKDMIIRTGKNASIQEASPEAEVILRNARAYNSTVFAKIDSVMDEGINTEVFAVQNIEVDNATITLPKTGDVDTIFKCDDANLDFLLFECSQWTRTDIAFVDYGDSVTFTVDRFSAYAGGNISAGETAYLIAWDENDQGMPNASQQRIVDQQVKFFADYRVSENGTKITDGTCTVSFDGGANQDMTYNSTYTYYLYNRSFSNQTTYLYNVECSSAGYTTVSATDSIIITNGSKTGAVSTIAGAVPFYTTSSNPTTCSVERGGESCNANWTVNATGMINTTHTFFIIGNMTTNQQYVNDTTSENISITIALNDTVNPVVISTVLSPTITYNNSPVTVFMTVSDNVQVDSCWINVSTPNGSYEMITDLCSGAQQYTPTQVGTFNLTYKVNDSSGLVGVSNRTLIVTNPVQFVVYTNNSNGSIDTNLSITYPPTGELIYSNNTNGSLNITIPDALFNVIFEAFGDRLNITIPSLNVSQESGKLFGMDKLSTALSGYLLDYGINSSYNFTNGIVVIKYDDASFSNEGQLRLELCSDWNFANQSCNGVFSDVTSNATQNTVKDTFTITVNSFSGFGIREEEAVVEEEVAAVVGGGRGGGCFVGWQCEDWGECTPAGVQTRTCECECIHGNCFGDNSTVKSCTYAPPKPKPKEPKLEEVEPEVPEETPKETPKEAPLVAAKPVVVKKHITGRDILFYITYGLFGGMLSIMGTRRLRIVRYRRQSRIWRERL